MAVEMDPRLAAELAKRVQGTYVLFIFNTTNEDHFRRWILVNSRKSILSIVRNSGNWKSL